MFIVCISLSINKSFAQQESVQDKLMKYKWVMDCREDGPITVGYTTYTKTSYIYNMDDIGQEPAIAPYYLSRNMQSLSFNESRVGKKINGKYLYTHTNNSLGRPKRCVYFQNYNINRSYVRTSTYCARSNDYNWSPINKDLYSTSIISSTM